jgi:hypothetical protein
VPDTEFASAIAGIVDDRMLHSEMCRSARAYALTAGWDRVFEGMYATYEKMLSPQCIAI